MILVELGWIPVKSLVLDSNTSPSSNLLFRVSQCANIGPADYNYDETISTLRYANRAKNIKNKARINEDPKDALLRQFQKEIEELKKKLEEGEIPLPAGVCLDKCSPCLSVKILPYLKMSRKLSCCLQVSILVLITLFGSRRGVLR